MRISKLIELLEKLPKEDEIEYRDGEWWCWFSIKEIRRMKCIEVKDKSMFSVWWYYTYYTDLEEDEFEQEINQLKSQWKDFKVTHKRVIK